MALIETEEAAGRLARVIASDIKLYNKKKIEAGADLTAEVEEGYRLFRARVAPSLLPVFETVLSDKGLLAGKTPPPARIAPPAAAPSAPPAPRYEAASAPTEPRYEGPTEPRYEGPTEPRYEAPSEPRGEGPTEPRYQVSADLSASAERAQASAPVVSGADEDLPAVAPISQTPRFAAFAPPPSDNPMSPAEEPSATEERPTFEAARRLARVIISDIKIYNPKKIENGEDLTREIEEGRQLFKTRIGVDLLPLFETMLEESGLVKPKPRPAPVRRPTPAAAAPRRLPTPAAPVAAAPPAPVFDFSAEAPVEAPADPPPAAASFPFDEPTQPLEDRPVYGAEASRPRVATPVPDAEAASALSRVDTPFPGINAAPLRTPTPFLDGPIMRAPNTPGPRRAPPPIPAEARTLKPVPLPGSVTPPPAALTPPPEPVTPPAAAPALLSNGRFRMPGVPDAAPVAVTTSHRRKPPIRLALASAAIAVALALAYLLFSL
jgi:hypothetical protein